MGKIYLIGGGEISRGETRGIDEEVLRGMMDAGGAGAGLRGEAGLDREITADVGGRASDDEVIVDERAPFGGDIVFIGAASGDAEGYFEGFKAYYTEILRGMGVGLPESGIEQARELGDGRTLEPDRAWGGRADSGAELPEFVFLTREFSREEFAKAVGQAGVVYLGGGATKPLLEALAEWGAEGEFRKALERGATLVGMSAGAYALAAKSIHVEADGSTEVNEGLGLVPVMCQAHATEESRAVAEEVARGMGLPLVALGEGEGREFRVGGKSVA